MTIYIADLSLPFPPNFKFLVIDMFLGHVDIPWQCSWLSSLGQRFLVKLKPCRQLSVSLLLKSFSLLVLIKIDLLLIFQVNSEGHHGGKLFVNGETQNMPNCLNRSN